MADLVLLAPYYPLRGGIAQHSAYLADSLHKSGVALKVISYRRQYPAWLYPGRGQREFSPPPVELLPVDYLYDPLNPLTWITVVHEIQRSDAKVVLLPWWHTFWAPGYAWLARRLIKNGKKVIFLVHNALPHERHIGDRFLAQMALRQADGSIVHAETQKKVMEELIGTSKAIDFVPHPLYPPQIVLPNRENARKKLCIAKDDFLFLTFGFQRPYKGVDDLLNAYMHLGNPDNVRLAVIGEVWGKQVPALPNIRFLDKFLLAEELAQWIAAADWYVAANRSATQSGSLALAMGCGLPMIVSDALEFQAEQACYLPIEIFSAGNVGGLTAVMKNVLSLPTPKRMLPDVAPGWQALAQTVIKMGGQ